LVEQGGPYPTHSLLYIPRAQHRKGSLSANVLQARCIFLINLGQLLLTLSKNILNDNYWHLPLSVTIISQNTTPEALLAAGMIRDACCLSPHHYGNPKQLDYALFGYDASKVSGGRRV
jgi:hypothetical protein